MNLTPTQKAFYDSAFSIAIQQGADHNLATAVASQALINYIPAAVPRTDVITTAFEFQRSGEEIVIQTDGDEEYVTAVLAGNDHLWTDEELKRFMDAVNNEAPVGDIDHETLKSMLKSGMTNAEIKEKIKDKKGIVKAVKALVENGSLYLRLAIDKRYKNIVKKAKGLSVEAVRTLGKVGSGQFLGFTVAVNEDPAYSGSTFIS